MVLGENANPAVSGDSAKGRAGSDVGSIWLYVEQLNLLTAASLLLCANWVCGGVVVERFTMPPQLET
jgi:hypothetical protein